MQRAGALGTAPDTQSSPPHADSALPHNWTVMKSTNTTESAEKAYAAFPSDNRYFSDGKRESQDPGWGSEKDLRMTVERP
ncbi:hypothetical protein GRJ2_002443400 [Grus japonensis]|uniref:Uncharacterized protein n=1 Tax=Grus japonensis TaxID=30415 RepID=A0ABC9XPX9_GRUJA